MRRSGTVGVCVVLSLIGVTLYMAFAFPYTLLHLKQSETTEIKAVIVVARNGEQSPSSDSYFMGEEPPEELQQLGCDQLTNTGKERMYLLGKYLKLKYYNLLLNGNPRKVHVRSADFDRCLESSEALLAGLNPPREKWIWSMSDSNELLINWQPKAIHTTDPKDDDLLSSESACLKSESSKLRWKNSTSYQQLVNEFRHDLQTLRQNTGLEFEDDLEMLTDIEDSLRTRLAFKESDTPSWYTSTYANRLAHIAAVSTGSRYSEPEVQRLWAGRLLHEIIENVNEKIRQTEMTTTTASSSDELPSTTINPVDVIGLQDQQPHSKSSKPIGQSSSTATNSNFSQQPNMFIYMTDKQHLSALLKSLQVYTSQPLFGSLLLIELHHDPINQKYFLRLYTLSSTSPNVFPEPVRVNPVACADSAECEPQQFEQNMRHLATDKASWQTACLEHMSNSPSNGNSKPRLPTSGTNENPAPIVLPEITGEPTTTRRPDAQQELQTLTPTAQTTTATPFDTTTDLGQHLNELDDKLIVGPTHLLESTTQKIEELDEKLIVGPIDLEPPRPQVVNESSIYTCGNESTSTTTSEIEPTDSTVSSSTSHLELISSTTEPSPSDLMTSNDVIATSTSAEDVATTTLATTTSTAITTTEKRANLSEIHEPIGPESESPLNIKSGDVSEATNSLEVADQASSKPLVEQETDDEMDKLVAQKLSRDIYYTQNHDTS